MAKAKKKRWGIWCKEGRYWIQAMYGGVPFSGETETDAQAYLEELRQMYPDEDRTCDEVREIKER